MHHRTLSIVVAAAVAGVVIAAAAGVGRLILEKILLSILQHGTKKCQRILYLILSYNVVFLHRTFCWEPITYQRFFSTTSAALRCWFKGILCISVMANDRIPTYLAGT